MSTDAVFRRLHQILSAPTLHRVYGHPGMSKGSDSKNIFETKLDIVHNTNDISLLGWGPWRTLGDMPSFGDDGLVIETFSRLCGLIIVDYRCGLYNEENDCTERKSVYVEMDALTGRIYTRRSEHTIEVCVERRRRTVRESRHVYFDIDTERIPSWERHLIESAQARVRAMRRPW